MQRTVIFMGDVSTQMVNIKKVSADSDRKVTVTMEFLATDEKARENVFKLFDMQGEMAEMTVRPAQGELFDEKDRGTAKDTKGGNGKKVEEGEPVHAEA
jgi:hypothetical protein